ncbi:MAG TPA: cyanophycinase [Sphingopyxis sp.]|uniref:cyanophycinase n=1 Tax=Sphingopyxis sp. TaxID=1908224 RepID=UPI002CF12BC9|nr:cyanophycinase [Sphingopyxis sp.]HWW55502.1 cyanophycinase [Sphingopyxis sp.]
MSEQSNGPLIAIGGHEDKDGERRILKAIAERLNGGRLIIATVASHEPEGYFDAYKDAFAALGATDLIELYVDDRDETNDPAHKELIDGAAGIFFTGGDQLRIVSQLGDTPLESAVRDLHARGGVIAGTSAGASAQSETMLIGGSDGESYRIGELHMAPGLGLIPSVIIDQHFAERGRIGRLLGAVAHNPRILGIGIDEDTAIVVDGERFKVIGSGAVTIVDAEHVTRSNIAEAKPQRVLSIHNVTLHALSAGDEFNLATRKPCSPSES